MSNGELVISDWARDLLHEAAAEVEQVARAQNIELPYRDAARQAEQVARLTGRNQSSMLQDVLRGAETEIENINGAIVRRGEIVGVPTPVNAMLYRLIKAIDEMRGA
jgi:2-dehydropantoate 2-reductase